MESVTSENIHKFNFVCYLHRNEVQVYRLNAPQQCSWINLLFDSLTVILRSYFPFSFFLTFILAFPIQPRKQHLLLLLRKLWFQFKISGLFKVLHVCANCYSITEVLFAKIKESHLDQFAGHNNEFVHKTLKKSFYTRSCAGKRLFNLFINKNVAEGTKIASGSTVLYT